jgi:hypothetical protein
MTLRSIVQLRIASALTTMPSLLSQIKKKLVKSETSLKEEENESHLSLSSKCLEIAASSFF